jgi:hypothetical protein
MVEPQREQLLVGEGIDITIHNGDGSLLYGEEESMSLGDLASEATQVAGVSIGSMEADQYKYMMLSEAGLALVFDYSVDDDIIRAIDLESGAQRWKQTDYRWSLEKYQAATERARQLAEGDDALFVHAYDDPDIVAGQGTLGVELYEQVPDVDTVIVPIGGGGLIGGVSTALAGVAPDVRVVGVQTAGAATVPQSLDKGVPVPIDAPETIADGIATGSISELTLDLIEQHVDEVSLSTTERSRGPSFCSLRTCLADCLRPATSWISCRTASTLAR